MTATPPDDDDLVPVSVRLGTVVPPDDPEDWTRPLTWIAAIGMLAAPLVTVAWFLIGPPTLTSAPVLGTFAVALVLAAGAALVGSTQMGRLRACTGTIAAVLLAAVLVIAVGAALAGERQVGSASPTLAHALAAAVAGLAGALLASGVNALVARWRSRPARAVLSAFVGAVVALVVLPGLFGG
ncbi:MAG: hypothetical protein WED86_07315 [Chloroflexota bacterium]